jgi:uncharacterized RDD family membrane protein YckC
MDTLSRFVQNITDAIIEPVIFFLFALAFYYFVLGLIPFVLNSDDPKARSVGRGHLIWGIIGFLIMTSVYVILQVITYTFCGTPFCKG